MELNDVWRDLRPNNPGFTWRRKNPTPIFERLDFFLISQVLCPMAYKPVVLPSCQSDHSMVKLDIRNKFFQRGKGYWKLNTQLLHDEEYVTKMNNLIDIELAQAEHYQSKMMHWEMLKLSAAGSTFQYATNKKASENNKLAVLEKKLKFWEDERDESSIFTKHEEYIFNLKKEINAIVSVVR